MWNQGVMGGPRVGLVSTLVAASLLAGGCDRGSVPVGPPAPDPPVHGDHRLASTTGIGDVGSPTADDGEIPIDDVAIDDVANAGFYWKDYTDGGDDPWEPGCHLEYSDDQCDNPTGGSYGDDPDPNSFPVGNPPVYQELREWTNQECHPERPFDDAHHNCDVLCQDATQTPDGVAHDHGCVGIVNANCPDGTVVTSAKCMCWDNPNPPPMECTAAVGGGGGGGGGTWGTGA